MELENISPEQSTRIVATSIELMSALSDAYGPEKGLELRDTIESTLGEEIKYAMFMTILTGDGTGKVVIPGHKDHRDTGNGSIIRAIKAIRAATGMGLKESKEIYDLVNDGQTQTVTVAFKHRATLISDLKNAGLQAY